MTSCRGSLLAALLGAALAACTQLASRPPAAGHPVVLAREDLSPGFIGFIGPKTQHAPPFLDTPGTNFDCLRSFLDRRTGEAVHQLYVSDSYFGAERDWNAARDSIGRPLPFVSLSRDEITCDNGCSYVEEFAVTLPESQLRANSGDLPVTFVARSGDEKTILVSGERIVAQLAAVDARRNPAQPVAAIGITRP
jgi:hypothetical protein